MPDERSGGRLDYESDRDMIDLNENGGFAQRFKIGVDATLLSRIEALIRRHGLRFLRRFLSQREIEYCLSQHPSNCANQYTRKAIQRAAGRFAAKEAVMKVLGKGWPEVSWTDIEILPGENRRPKVFLDKRVLSYTDWQSLVLRDIDVSITHDGDLAVAVALGVYARKASF